ncbi:MAG: PAS domain S-box protein [Dehalococcoidales bacterium]|nr:PAS domain S-box protein [Dehalococcoidales bacterium]
MATAKGASETTTYLMVKTLRRPHLWVAAVMVAVLVIIHYPDIFAGVWGLGQVSSIFGFGLTRHTLERILFLIPVAYGAATLGLGGGLSILFLAAAAMLPRVFLVSPAPREAIFETAGVICTGALIVFLFDALQKGKQRLIEVETTHQMLNTQIRRLGMLHAISGTVSQSLELSQVLSVIDKVKQLMGMEAAWLYFWDEPEKELKLASSAGTSMPRSIKPGDNFDGKAAQSRQPVIIENMAAGGAPDGGLQSLLVVPLMSKAELVGTLGVGSRSVHTFSADEVDLLRAIGDQIGMAVENSRLYERERLSAEALRASERNYRELFENASDAIWVHDLNGKILAVNSALARLTGYEHGALVGANISLLVPCGLTSVGKCAHDAVLKGEAPPSYEQVLALKDGSAVIVQIGTSLVTRDEDPWAFQHIARDITEAKAAQDNLRYYVQRVSQAQEAERKRIARELHDETAQGLVAVIRNLDDMAEGHSRYSVKDVQEQVREVLRGVRQFSQQLRPSILDDLGLVPALKWLASDLNGNGIAVNVEVNGTVRQLLPEAELTLFRIAQEALNNARRHSGANRVSIGIDFGEHKTTMKVSDNGRGFELPARVGDLARVGKLGLAGMQERAQLLGGIMAIDAAPGRGTNLTVEVPG